MWQGILTCASVFAIIFALPTTTEAQGASRAPDSTWEVSIQVDFGKASTPQQGRGQLPEANPSFPLSGLSATRFVPSWFFGDGAALANGNLAQNAVGTKVNPLDDVLMSSSAALGSGFSVGARLTRRLSARWALEATLDVNPSPFAIPDETMARLVTSAASFDGALDQIIQGAFPQTSSVSTHVETVGQGVQVAIGGILRFRLSYTTESRPFLFAGGGWLLQSGSHSAVSVTGEYEFVRALSNVPIHETDTLRINYRTSSAPFVRLGGGVTRDLGRRFGVRAELALTLSPNRLSVSIDTAPSFGQGAPAGTVTAVGLANSIRFSNVLETPSSLNSVLSGFETFAGSGWRANFTAGGGVFVRF